VAVVFLGFPLEVMLPSEANVSEGPPQNLLQPFYVVRTKYTGYTVPLPEECLTPNIRPSV
jgi:hypothetical protein